MWEIPLICAFGYWFQGRGEMDLFLVGYEEQVHVVVNGSLINKNRISQPIVEGFLSTSAAYCEHIVLMVHMFYSEQCDRV